MEIPEGQLHGKNLGKHCGEIQRQLRQSYFYFTYGKKKDKKRKCCIVDVLTQSPQKCPASKGQLTSGGFGANQHALLFKKKKKNASGPVAVVARNPPSGFFARK